MSGPLGASSSAVGILLHARLTGLVRQRVFAHYFGLGSEADAFSAAFRIPTSSRICSARGRCRRRSSRSTRRSSRAASRREADRVAGAVASLLALVVSAIVLAGVLATPVLIALIAPGFTGETACADDSSSCGSCFRAPACWCCPRGASAC